MSIVVRLPAFDDVARLATINVDAWRAAYAGIVPADYLDSRDRAEYEQRWRLNIDPGRPGVSYLVAELDGILAGYVICGAYRLQQDGDPTEDTTTWASCTRSTPTPTSRAVASARPSMTPPSTS